VILPLYVRWRPSYDVAVTLRCPPGMFVYVVRRVAVVVELPGAVRCL